MKVSFKNSGIRIAAILMVFLMIIITTGISSFATELPGDALRVSTAGGDRYIMQGSSGDVSIKIENQMSSPITYDEVKINLKDSAGLKVNVKNTGTVTLNKKGDSAEIGFNVTASKYCTATNVSYTFTLYNKGEEIYSSRYFYFFITEYSSTGPGANAVSVEINASIEPEDGFYIGSNNHLLIECYNATSSRLKNATVTLTLPEGVGIHGGASSANLGYIDSAKKKTCDFNIQVEKDAVSGNKQFVITVTGTDDQNQAVSVVKTFFFNVNAKDKKEDDSKKGETNPRIMLKDYSIPGTAVAAGSTFDLGLDLINTSNKTLYNIKVTVSANGPFVPAKGSNSYFIEKMVSKGTDHHSIALSVPTDAEQKVSSINITTAYEDSSGTAFSSEDVISIKVNQNSRLVIGEFTAPREAYVGDSVSCSIKYFNMGKTTLNNLMIDANGNFSTMESNSDFVGNFAPGAKGEYEFYATANEAGTVEGNIIFQYDDPDGNTVVEQIPFKFEASEYTPMGDEGGMEEPMPEKKGIPKSIIIAGIVLLLLIIIALIAKKIIKKKAARKLELDDAAFELEFDNKKTKSEEASGATADSEKNNTDK